MVSGFICFVSSQWHILLRFNEELDTFFFADFNDFKYLVILELKGKISYQIISKNFNHWILAKHKIKTSTSNLIENLSAETSRCQRKLLDEVLELKTIFLMLLVYLFVAVLVLSAV